MAGMYSMKDLLSLLVQESAEELRLEPARPPMMQLRGKLRVLDGPLVTSDEITDLVRGIATEAQLRELDLCGNLRFRFSTEQLAPFSVVAKVQCASLSVTIKNLGR